MEASTPLRGPRAARATSTTSPRGEPSTSRPRRLRRSMSSPTPSRRERLDWRESTDTGADTPRESQSHGATHIDRDADVIFAGRPAKFGRSRPMVARFSVGLNLAAFGRRNSIESDRNYARPNIPQIGPNLADFGKQWPFWANLWAGLAENGGFCARNTPSMLREEAVETFWSLSQDLSGDRSRALSEYVSRISRRLQRPPQD